MNLTYGICSTDEDMEAAWEVCIKAFENIPYSFSVPKQHFIRCYKDSTLLISKDENKVVGVLLCSVEKDAILRVLIGAVLSEYRSLGITEELGALLREELAKDTRGAKGLEMLILHFKKESADRFLVDKLGYRWVGQKRAPGSKTLLDIYYRDL